MEEMRGPDGLLTERVVRVLFERAVEHFEAGRLHEAHELWEPLWHEAKGPRRTCLHGLIQVAAALHHFEKGASFSFADLLRSGARLLATCGERAEGLDLEGFRRDLAPWVAHAERVLAGATLRADAPRVLPRLRSVGASGGQAAG